MRNFNLKTARQLAPVLALAGLLAACGKKEEAKQAGPPPAVPVAVYKGALSQLNALQDNLVDAKEVYRVINLQYREGIKTFLELTIAEADLRTAQLTYYNALFNVLSSKLDVQRALGNITFNQ